MSETKVGPILRLEIDENHPFPLPVRGVQSTGIYWSIGRSTAEVPPQERNERPDATNSSGASSSGAR
jgi:hypothetical protein